MLSWESLDLTSQEGPNLTSQGHPEPSSSGCPSRIFRRYLKYVVGRLFDIPKFRFTFFAELNSILKGLLGSQLST